MSENVGVQQGSSKLAKTALVLTVLATLLAVFMLQDLYDLGSAFGSRDTSLWSHGWFVHDLKNGYDETLMGTGATLAVVYLLPLIVAVIAYFQKGFSRKLPLVSLGIISTLFAGTALIRLVGFIGIVTGILTVYR